MPDFYDILGIARNATPELIRAAHRVQSRRYHPDTADDGKGDAALFAQIQEAYETLSNPDTRRRYDTKEGFNRGEYSAGSKRRPPKSPCGACGTAVYASQLKLYLGRHICQTCFERKRVREENRLQFSRWAEMTWKLKRLQVWAQSHWVLLTVFSFAAIAVGARLMSLNTPSPSPDLPSTQVPTTTTQETSSANPINPFPGNPCLTSPISSAQTSEIPPGK